MNLLKASPSILFVMVLGLAFVMGACDKEDTAVVIDNPIIGTWESTTFQVSDCAEEGDNVELRECGFSDHDDFDCSMVEFRSDGRYVEDGEALEGASKFTISGNMITLIFEEDDSLAFRFEASDNAMTWYYDEFNGVGCKLAFNLARVK